MIDFDSDKVDEYTLALMYLVMHQDSYGTRVWKGFDWDTLERLHNKGFIANPKGKTKSIVVLEEGEKKIFEFFKQHFAKQTSHEVVSDAEKHGVGAIKVKVKLDELLEAIERHTSENEAFVNAQDGTVFILTEDTKFVIENDEVDYPDWQKEDVQQAKVYLDNPKNYINVPTQWDANEYEMMEDFVSTLEDENQRDKLLIAGQRRV